MKNYRKIVSLFILIMLCANILTGCSGSESFSDSGNIKSLAMREDSGGDAAYGNWNRYDYDTEYFDIMPADERMEMEAEVSYEMLSSDGSAGSNLPADRKIIRDANITMEVEDVEQSYDNILRLLGTFGGYEARRDMHSNNYDGYKNYPTVGATLKIPAAQLDSFLAKIKEEGETISSSITSSDISDQYYDSKIRITTLEKTLDNYYGFLENAQDVDEQLRVTRYINDITNEIEQLKGSIKRWDSLVDYSTVNLNLYRPYEAPVPEPEPREIDWDALTLEDMGWYISSGFLGVCNVIFSVIQWIIIIIATISPAAVPIAVILFFVIRYEKKRRKKYMKNKSVSPAVNSEEDNNI